MSFDSNGDYVADSEVHLADVRKALIEKGASFGLSGVPFARVSLEVAVACLAFADWLGHDAYLPTEQDAFAMAASDASDGRLKPVLPQLGS